MSSVLVADRVQSADTNDIDGWVSLPSSSSRPAAESPIRAALKNLAKDYSQGRTASSVVPAAEHLRPMEERDRLAEEYLDSVYGD